MSEIFQLPPEGHPLRAFFEEVSKSPDLRASWEKISSLQEGDLHGHVGQSAFEIFEETPDQILGVEEILNRTVRLHGHSDEILNHARYFQLFLTHALNSAGLYRAQTMKRWHPVFSLGL